MAYQSLMDLMNADAMQQGQMRAQAQQGQLQQLQLGQAQEDMQRKAQLRDLLPQIMGSGDPQSMLQKLMQTGNPDAIAMAGQLAPVMNAMQRDNNITYEDFGGYKQGRDARGQLVGQPIQKTAMPKDKAQWSEPFDMRGVMVQKNNDTGEIKTSVTREPRINISGGGGNPYFTPVQTAQGVMAFNARTGRVEPVSINGSPIVGSSSDPKLQGQIATSKTEGKDIGEQRALIVGKQNSLESVKTAKAFLNDGIYAGAWGPLTKETIKRLPLTDKTKAARTEAFISEIGNVVIPRLKEFGGNDSNEELRYLQKVMGGDVTMEPAALKSALTSAEIKIQRGIDRLNSDGNSRLNAPGKTAPAIPKTVDFGSLK